MSSSAPLSALASRAEAGAAAPAFRAWRHRFACFHVFATFVLLIAGATVTSNDAGLSVADWPSSLGFFNPLALNLRGLMHGLVALEHGHREVGMVVGLLTIVETVWLWNTASRRAHRVLGVTLLAAVIVQGVLGGLTVRLRLPPAVSVAHGMLAQSFFCLSIATAWLLSREFRETGTRAAEAASPRLRRAALLAAGSVYLQLLFGAIVRHTVAKWRVPVFGDAAVVLHMSFAAVVVVAIGILVARAAVEAQTPRFTRPAFALGLLVVVQAALGLLTVVTRTDPLVSVLHVITGATILGLAALLSLRVLRVAPPAAATREAPR